MARTNVTDHLAQVPLFAACSKKELAHIARATDEITLKDGHVLTTQDETSREAFVIIPAPRSSSATAGRWPSWAPVR